MFKTSFVDDEAFQCMITATSLVSSGICFFKSNADSEIIKFSLLKALLFIFLDGLS